MKLTAPLTLLMGSLITLTGAVAGPILTPPPTTYYESTPPVMQAPPSYEVAPLPPTVSHESMYAPEINEYQTIVPYVQQPARLGPELYPNVVYKDEHRKHPAAVPYLVEVPLYKPILPRRRANYCGPDCAHVLICVPPCDTPRVRVTRRGHKLRYDFGKFEVDVIVYRNGRVVVDYDC
ncbi:hypothetical protein [Rubinisphaera margarita]|uniref:hypothetical protein n=1 Tax=Rubinisphaera margarita TaxID=2909586 RepID=UPI001EE97A1B|nr:hypothetical protein [Rubinisphaera margarita]MCG6156659.1 hypothetical protein [Rubinisphaera margarita]